MQPQEFSKLPFESKLQWLFFEGEFVMDIRYYGFKVNLYLLKDFYIEVFYHHKQDRLVKIEILDEASTRMKFYSDQVRLSELVGI